MNYYPFHLGDYAAHTGHLEPLEDLAYRRMLDSYYLREAPLPADPVEVARLIRMRQNMAEVEAVLREFFQFTEDGWSHARCDEEIERMQDKQAKARASAAASVNARRAKAERPLNGGIANAERTLNDRSTDVQLPTPTPTPTPKEEKGEVVVGGVGEGGKKPPQDPGADDAGITGDAPAPTPPAPPRADPEPPKAVAAARPADVDAQTWGDFLALRRAKKAPVTETVLKRASAEAQKAGMPLAQFLAVWCARGSQGLEAAWLTPEERRPTRPGAPAETFRERDERNARQRWEEMTGRVHPDNQRDRGQVIDITPAAAPLIPIGAAK